MPLRSNFRSETTSNQGVALIMVLAFIVLLTILIISFISFSRLNRLSTASYSKSIQAQEIAQGGIEDILNDFHQEIVAGSTLQNGGSSTYAPVYLPTTNWTAQPARLGYASTLYGVDVTSTNLPPSLVRVSRASPDSTPTDFSPWGASPPSYYIANLMTNRASAANTSTASINGRSISAARWNKIALLATNSVIPPAFATNTPDWVYVTRGGSRPCVFGDLTSTTASIKPSSSLTSTNAVVGRYAYAIYDEGALLDINAAGYISSATNSYTVAQPTTIYTNSPTGISQVITSKTYTSYADLTQLPGLNSTGAQTNIDNLVAWRNGSANLTGPGAGTNYYQAVFNNAKVGFRTFSAGDSPVLGRQDLINYFSKLDPSGTSYAAALPFLGTFSRAGNAPSWTPLFDSTGLPGYVGGAYNGIASVSYHANAESATTTLMAAPSSPASAPATGTFPNPNRDIPNVRYPASTPADTAITHYADDGTPTTYYVNPGDPLVQHRFSLGKLSWLTYKGPSADLATSDPLYNPGGSEANIRTCFGLKWTTNEGYSCWQYLAGVTSPAGIETLDQVANGSTSSGDTGYREPNFFEMLKAGILAGSLGQTPGPLINGETATIPGNWNSGGPVEGIPGSGFVTYSGSRDRHLLQIGANLIDQSDADSYPTTIYMKLFTSSGSQPLSQEIDLSANMVYGDENLPMLSRMCPIVVDIPSTSFKLWYQPEIWNPHQAVGIGTKLSAPSPTNFRVHAYGTVQLTVKNGNNSSAVTDTALSYDSDAGATFSYTNMSGASVPTAGSDLAVVNFSDANNGTLSSPFYNNPIRLDQNTPANDVLTANTLTFPSSTALVNYWGELGYVKNLPADYSSTGYYSATSSGSLQSDSSEKFAAVFAGECDGVDLTKGTWTSYNTIYCLVTPSPTLTFSLDYEDAAGAWHPYNFMANIKDQSTNYYFPNRTSNGQAPPAGTPVNYNTGSNTPVQGTTIYSTDATWSHVDPRTDRFSCLQSTSGGSGRWNMDCTVDPGPDSEGWSNNSMGSQGRVQGTQQTLPYRSYGFVYYPTAPPSFAWESYNFWFGFWSVNQPGSILANAYYIDPDGVVRPGDAYRRDPSTLTSNSPNYSSSTTGDGSLFWNASYGTTSPAAPTNLAGASTSTNLGSAQARRAVVLNRPFRSVGEMGYAFRDIPFKTLDFFSKESGDAALLDLFSVADEPAVSAGQVDLSNAPASVVKAILNNSSKMEINNQVSNSTGFPNFLTQADATAATSAIVTYLSKNGPLSNRVDLVTKLSDPIFTSLYASTVGSGGAAGSANYANKAYAEAPMRALSSVASTRTWNLLIDIVAQSGFMAPTATTLNDFVVEGERRYWLHISIDRYTGKILDQQLESIYE
jgi:hypothetical protein